jgi:hypothetical protein
MTDPTPTPLTDAERDMAEHLCRSEQSWEHHDLSDDFPCSACWRYARIAVARETAARADERERVVSAVHTTLIAVRARAVPLRPDNTIEQRIVGNAYRAATDAVLETLNALAHPADTEGGNA